MFIRCRDCVNTCAATCAAWENHPQPIRRRRAREEENRRTALSRGVTSTCERSVPDHAQAGSLENNPGKVTPAGHPKTIRRRQRQPDPWKTIRERQRERLLPLSRRSPPCSYSTICCGNRWSGCCGWPTRRVLRPAHAWLPPKAGGGDPRLLDYFFAVSVRKQFLEGWISTTFSRLPSGSTPWRPGHPV